MAQTYGAFHLPVAVPENAVVFQVTRTNLTATDADMLATISNPATGNYAVITTVVSGKTYGKVAYVYADVNGVSGWQALTGEVDASSVIIRGDTTLAGNYTQVGNVTKAYSGVGTLNTDGMSVADLLTEIFNKTVQPTVTNPSASALTAQVNGGATLTEHEVAAGDEFSLTVGSTFNPGSYSFGPATGVTVTASKLVLTSSKTGASTEYALTEGAGTITGLTVEDGETLTGKVVYEYSAGVAAVDNKGEASDPAQSIAAGSCEVTGFTITGAAKIYAKSYASGMPATFDATAVKAMTAYLYDADGISFPGVNNATGVAFAVPSANAATALRDLEAMNINILSEFARTTLTVDGVEYYVYAYTPATTLQATTYTVEF